MNGTTAIFEFIIANMLNQTLDNINWTLDMGDGSVINSTLPFNLTSQEDIFNYIEYQYFSSGSYVVTATTNANGLIDSQMINITM